MKTERQSPLQNMSTPPRSTLTFRALAVTKGKRGDPVSDGVGLTFVCRFDTGTLVPKRYRIAPARRGSPGLLKSANFIRAAYSYARAEGEGHKRPNSAVRNHAAVTPVEVLADELRDIAASVSLPAAGLPPFGLLLPTHGIDREAESSRCVTLAILARRRGTVFLRDADPIVWSAIGSEVLDLWVPDTGPGSRR